jgi:hypothetical protein
MRYILIIVLLSGCDKIGNSEPELLVYLSRFINDASDHNVGYSESPIQLVFSDDLGGSAGRCSKDKHIRNLKKETQLKVQILKSYWDNLNDNDKELLMYHELGHCLLNREHNEIILSDGSPKSIMRSHLIEGFYTDVSKPYYLLELFRPNDVLSYY